MSNGSFDPAWLKGSALLLVDMNRSHLDHSIGHMLVAKPDADRIIVRAYVASMHKRSSAARPD